MFRFGGDVKKKESVRGGRTIGGTCHRGMLRLMVSILIYFGGVVWTRKAPGGRVSLAVR